MRALLVAIALVAMPAAAQWKLPDELPPLPRDGEVCNEKRTHCIVNARDWAAHKAATEVLAQRIVQLQIALAEEQATKEKRCAVVTPSTRDSVWILPR